MSNVHSASSFSTASVPARSARRPVLQFAAFALVGLGLVIGAALVLTGPSALALALSVGGYSVGVVLAIGFLRRGFPHPTLGFCNVVTLARLALTAALLAPLAHQEAIPWAVFGIAAVALALDGADGWLARREGRTSSFGARFDMEVDAGLGLILALNAWALNTWAVGLTGALVLLIGMPRYVFVVAAVALPWLGQALPDRFGRKVVCVLQIAVLIVLQLPIVSAGVATILAAVAAVILLWSFGRDVVWLWRHST